MRNVFKQWLCYWLGDEMGVSSEVLVALLAFVVPKVCHHPIGMNHDKSRSLGSAVLSHGITLNLLWRFGTR